MRTTKGKENKTMIEFRNDIYTIYTETPIDKNDPEAAKTAVEYTTPGKFSKKARAGREYLDDTMHIFLYKDKLVVTDESYYLTTHGDGSMENPMGFPRGEFDSWEELEEWLEAVYEDALEDGLIEPIKE